MTAAASAGVVTILFTDVVQSTERLVALGDERADELRRREFGLLRTAIESRGGSQVKSEGDGIMAAFPSPLRAVQCAVEMQESVQEHNAALAEYERLAMRVGLHAGEPIHDEGDYFGAAVVAAERLCRAAVGGQIVTSDLVRALVGGRSPYAFRGLGALELKGIPEPVAACEILWTHELPRIREITVLLPNRPGTLQAVATRLRDEAIHIRGFHVANAGQSGFVQLVCTPHDRAIEVLGEQLRFYLLETEALAVRLADRPGELSRVLDVLANLRFNVSQSYLAAEASGRPAMIIEFGDETQRDVAARAMRAAGFDLLAAEELAPDVPS